MLLLRYIMIYRPLIPTLRHGRSVGVFGLAFSWLYLYHCHISAVLTALDMQAILLSFPAVSPFFNSREVK